MDDSHRLHDHLLKVFGGIIGLCRSSDAVEATICRTADRSAIIRLKFLRLSVARTTSAEMKTPKNSANSMTITHEIVPYVAVTDS